MDKKFYMVIMKQANGSLMAALENQIQEDMGGTREQANIAANHILGILDAHKRFNRSNDRKHCNDCPCSYNSCKYKTFNGICSYE